MLGKDNILAELLEKKHISDVVQIEAECFAEPWSEESLQLLVDGRGIGFVVCEGEKAVAYGGMLTVLDEGQITNIATDKAYRCRGYARAIMLALEDYAASHEIRLLSLEVRESNTAARDLYLSLGWQEAGIRKGFYRRPLENAVVMIKRI